MKILFYQASDVVDSAGGTEKVLCSLSSRLAQDGYDVVFVANEKKQGKPFFELDDRVKFANIGGTKFGGLRKTIFKLIKSTPLLKFFKYFDNYRYTSNAVHSFIEAENPDVIILANPSDMLELCYCNSYNAPIIQMIHGVPWNIFHRRSKSVLRETLRVVKKAAVCQVLLNSYVELMKPFYDGKVAVIPNIVPQMPSDFNCQYKNAKKNVIINVARITPVKNQALLIEAFAKIAAKYPDWEINIYGGDDKKYREKLDFLIEKYGLGNKILFMGRSNNILEKLKEASIFAFPSLFEGFSLALTEAMAVGLPAIGLKTAPAVNEIIIDGENGLLSNNDEADFAEKLEQLINNENLRKKLGTNARESVKKYEDKIIVNKWKELIDDIVNNRGKNL